MIFTNIHQSQIKSNQISSSLVTHTHHCDYNSKSIGDFQSSLEKNV